MVAKMEERLETSENRKKAGGTLMEVLCLFLLILTAFVGAHLGAKFGPVIEIVGMVAFPLCLILLIDFLAWLERELIMGRKPFPLCRCGKLPIDEMELVPDSRKVLRRCSCGLRYELPYWGKIILIDDTGEKLFARWKAFRRWELT